LRRFRAGSANDMRARLNPLAGKKFHAIQSAFNRSPGDGAFASIAVRHCARWAEPQKICQRRLLALAKEKQAGGFD
jgi:hypothetical protein